MTALLGVAGGFCAIVSWLLTGIGGTDLYKPGKTGDNGAVLILIGLVLMFAALILVRLA